jgi:hypothetical protein
VSRVLGHRPHACIIYIYIYIYIYMCVYIYIYMYICIYVYIYIKEQGARALATCMHIFYFFLMSRVLGHWPSWRELSSSSAYADIKKQPGVCVCVCVCVCVLYIYVCVCVYYVFIFMCVCVCVCACECLCYICIYYIYITGVSLLYTYIIYIPGLSKVKAGPGAIGHMHA